MSNVTHTSAKRGMVVSSDRSCLAVLSDDTSRLDNAGREWILMPKEQDFREITSLTYIRPLRYGTRGWLSVLLTTNQCQNRVWSESEYLTTLSGSVDKFCGIGFRLTCIGDGN